MRTFWLTRNCSSSVMNHPKGSWKRWSETISVITGSCQYAWSAALRQHGRLHFPDGNDEAKRRWGLGMIKEPVCRDKVTLLVFGGWFGGWLSLFMQQIFSPSSKNQRITKKKPLVSWVNKQILKKQEKIDITEENYVHECKWKCWVDQ